MTQSYDIVPGEKVGPFQLGDTLWHILELLRTEQTSCPKVEVSWDESHPHTSPIVIHLAHLTLYFPPSPTQVLGEITICDLGTPPLTLTYDSHTLCSPPIEKQPQTLLTRGLIGQVLGPTYDSKGSAGKLVYPGIAFHAGGKRGTSGGRDEVMDKVVVSPKEDAAGTERSEGLSRCVVTPGKGVTLPLGSLPPVEVILGQTTSQDLLLDLGPPLRKYWKEDERMEKMWGGRGGAPAYEANVGDCFLNYFQYGLDFLVSSDGVVRKIVAHSNIPGSPLFQRYTKCPWTISSSSAALDSTSRISDFHTAFSSSTSVPAIITPTPTSDHLAIPAVTSSGKKKKRSPSANSDRSATPDMAGGGSEDDKGKGGGRGSGEAQGMTLDRIGEGGLEGVTGEMRSRLVGFEGLVVEEDLASGGIASVLIYKAER